MPVLALFNQTGRAVDELPAGSTGMLAIARTPLYVESGGQVSDTGRIVGADGSEAIVERMIKQANRPRLHVVRVDRGTIRRGMIVTAEVVEDVRDATRKHHTATADRPIDVNGVRLVTKRVEGLEKRALRAVSDSLRDRLGSGVVVLASESDGKVALVVSVTKDLTRACRQAGS